MSGLLNVGISGLLVHQRALSATGNNISNADVEGYSRRRVELGTRPEQFTGGGFIGSGSTVQDIARVVDQFLLTQMRLDTTTYHGMEGFTKNIEQLNSLFANEASGLSPGIEAFFESIEAGAQDPTSMPARQLVISNAEALAERFNTLYDRLQQQTLALNDQIVSLTGEISSLAEGIAELNIAIEEDKGRGQDSEPNQLLDKRDELLRQLSEMISIRTSVEAGGSVNVFIGNGQPLVVGGTANQLQTTASIENPGNEDVVFVGPSFNQNITGLLSGGKLGGILEFRQGPMRESFNALGRVALGMAAALNEQQNQGLDLEGNFGRDIFKDINDPAIISERTIADSGNALPADRVINVRIDDISQLTTSDYTLVLSDPTSNGLLDYQVLRRRDGAVVSTGEFPAPGFPQTINVDGLEIELASGSFQAGDRFTLQPTRTGARDIDINIQRPQELAYASPVIGDASLSNTGSGTISLGEVIDVYDSNGALLSEFATPGQLSPPILIRFTNATTYDIYDNSNPAAPALISGGNGFTPGQVNTVTFGTPPAYEVDLNGFPDAGDEFTIGFNSNGTSDNRNAVAMGALRVNGTLENGGLNFEDAYGRLVEELGSRTAQSRISQEASQSLLDQSTARRESVSGVNLDEEAANLIRFEQAYNASAQVISVARQLFDTLLGAFR